MSFLPMNNEVNDLVTCLAASGDEDRNRQSADTQNPTSSHLNRPLATIAETLSSKSSTRGGGARTTSRNRRRAARNQGTFARNSNRNTSNASEKTTNLDYFIDRLYTLKDVNFADENGKFLLSALIKRVSDGLYTTDGDLSALVQLEDGIANKDPNSVCVLLHNSSKDGKISCTRPAHLGGGKFRLHPELFACRFFRFGSNVILHRNDIKSTSSCKKFKQESEDNMNDINLSSFSVCINPYHHQLSNWKKLTSSSKKGQFKVADVKTTNTAASMSKVVENVEDDQTYYSKLWDDVASFSDDYESPGESSTDDEGNTFYDPVKMLKELKLSNVNKQVGSVDQSLIMDIDDVIKHTGDKIVDQFASILKALKMPTSKPPLKNSRPPMPEFLDDDCWTDDVIICSPQTQEQTNRDDSTLDQNDAIDTGILSDEDISIMSETLNTSREEMPVSSVAVSEFKISSTTNHEDDVDVVDFLHEELALINSEIGDNHYDIDIPSASTTTAQNTCFNRTALTIDRLAKHCSSRNTASTALDDAPPPPPQIEQDLLDDIQAGFRRQFQQNAVSAPTVIAVTNSGTVVDDNILPDTISNLLPKHPINTTEEQINQLSPATATAPGSLPLETTQHNPVPFHEFQPTGLPLATMFSSQQDDDVVLSLPSPIELPSSDNGGVSDGDEHLSDMVSSIYGSPDISDTDNTVGGLQNSNMFDSHINWQQ